MLLYSIKCLKNLKHKNKIYKARVELDNARIGTVEISDRDSNYPYFELKQ